MQLIFARYSGNGITRGDIIEARASGAPFGGNEPNSFVMVEIPEPLSSLGQYGNKRWDRDISWSVQSSDLAADEFVLRVRAASVNSQSAGALSRANIERFLLHWNVAVVAAAVNAIDIRVNIFQVLQSNDFWHHDFATYPVDITELSYDQGTGIHRLQFDYSSLNKSPTAVEKRAVILGAEVISHAGRILIADFTRVDVRDNFFSEVKKKVDDDESVARYKYYVPASVVTFIEAQGGAYITDLATATGYIRDKVDD